MELSLGFYERFFDICLEKSISWYFNMAHIGNVLNSMALIYHVKSQYHISVEFAEKSRQILEKHVGKGHPFYLSCLANIAYFH